MNKLLEYLDNYNPVPTYSQIAIGRNWEDAVRIEFDEIIDYSNILKKLDDPTLAFEIFYKLNDGRNVFLGLRFSPEMKSISTREEFLHVSGEVLKLAPTSSIK